MIIVNSRCKVQPVKIDHFLEEDKGVEVFIMKKKEELDIYYAFEP